MATRRRSKKFDRCVRDVAKSGSAIDPFAVCQAQMKTRRLVRNPYLTNQKDLEKATKLYRDFREQPPKRGRVVEIEVPKIVMVMGNLTGIEYDLTRAGKVEKYRHEFNAGSKPVLCADASNGRLFIVEGRYHVTKRGIVDLDANGKELE